MRVVIYFNEQRETENNKIKKFIRIISIVTFFIVGVVQAIHDVKGQSPSRVLMLNAGAGGDNLPQQLTEYDQLNSTRDALEQCEKEKIRMSLMLNSEEPRFFSQQEEIRGLTEHLGYAQEAGAHLQKRIEYLERQLIYDNEFITAQQQEIKGLKDRLLIVRRQEEISKIKA